MQKLLLYILGERKPFYVLHPYTQQTISGTTSVARSTFDRKTFDSSTLDRFQCFRHWLGNIRSISYHLIDIVIYHFPEYKQNDKLLFSYNNMLVQLIDPMVSNQSRVENEPKSARIKRVSIECRTIERLSTLFQKMYCNT